MASISTDKRGNRRILFERDGKRPVVRVGKLPMKATQTIKTKIEALLAAQLARVSIDADVAEWLGKIDAKLYDKLEAVGLVPKRALAEQATLAAFVDSFIADRSDVKGTTAIVYGHTRRCLVNYFGADKPLAEITPGDADAWRRYLARPKPSEANQAVGEGLADNTVKRRCGIAKQLFRAAVRRKLIAENPFADMKGLMVRGNRTREFFVTQEMANRVLDACPDGQWRLLFALSRFGGLRCPSEHLALTWADVDWERSRMRVTCVKTAHHDGKAERWVPLFPELRPYLEAAWEECEPGTEWVITRYRDASQNLRTTLEKIIRRAGLHPWPKLWQNLRSTRQTELAESFPAHVVCNWIGNSQAVANEHYLQVTDDHFEKATRKQAQSEAVSTSSGSQATNLANEQTPVLPGLATPCDYWPICPVGDEGLEPPTSTV